jgi:hypothetical protein
MATRKHDYPTVPITLTLDAAIRRALKHASADTDESMSSICNRLLRVGLGLDGAPINLFEEMERLRSEIANLERQEVGQAMDCSRCCAEAVKEALAQRDASQPAEGEDEPPRELTRMAALLREPSVFDEPRPTVPAPPPIGGSRQLRIEDLPEVEAELRREPKRDADALLRQRGIAAKVEK